jgi:hypothetical protein
LTDPLVSTELFPAYSHSYATEANRRRIAFGVDLAFAVAALVLTVLTGAERSPNTVDLLTTWLPLAALLWLVLREIGILSVDQPHRRNAVNIQEQLDLNNWRGNDWPKHWNRLLAGEPVPARTIKQFASANPDAEMPADYWIDTTGLPDTDAALFRLEQTAAWGAEGHRRYALLNRYPALLGLVLVVVAALILDANARETAAAVIAIAPFLVGRIQSSREHAALAARRVSLEQHIQAVLDPERPSTDVDVRTAQDELYRLRMETRRIPSWLYNHYAERDRASIDGAIAARIEAFRAAMKP